MPMPYTYRHASAEFAAFLADAREALGLESDNATYTAVDAVFQVFRTRLSVEQALAFADLLPDSNPKNVSGYRWTSAVGPPKKITSGCLCTYQIDVEQKRPISYVIPMVKKTLGV